MKNTKIKLRQKYTEKGKSYLDGTGFYQKEFDELFKKVPPEGSAKTVNIELIRSVNNLAYEYFNNGNGNARKYSSSIDTYSCPECGGSGSVEVYEGLDDDETFLEKCPECEGTGEIEEEYEEVIGINKWFKSYLEFIESKIPETKELLKEIENIIINDDATYLKEDRYIKLTDIVVNYCINNEDIKVCK